jgi:hypothetical protein
MWSRWGLQGLAGSTCYTTSPKCNNILASRVACSGNQLQTPLWCVQLLATCQVHQIICQQHCRVHGSAATAAAAVAVLAAIGSRSGRGCNAYALPLASRLRCTL